MAVIAVSGASGWLGVRICQYLRSQKHTILALDRHGVTEGPWHKFAALDLMVQGGGDSGWKSALEEANVLIHCAGHAHRAIETSDEIKRFYQVNRDGTQLVLEACRNAGVLRFVYLGSMAYYNWNESVSMDEDSALNPKTAYAQSKLEGETAVVESNLDWRVARLATVFGEGDRANFSKLAQSLSVGRFVLPGNGTARKSVIPVDLAAEIICDLALRDNIPFRLFNVALPEAPSLDMIVKAFVRTCGFKQPIHVPVSLLNYFALIGNCVASVHPNFSLTSSNVRKLTMSTEVNVSRLLKLFPSRSWPTFSDSLAKHCAWYKKLGLENR